MKCAWGGSTKQFFQRRAYAEDTGEIDLTIRPHISCLQSYFEKDAAKLQKIFLLCENVKICPEKRNMACNASFLYEVDFIQQIFLRNRSIRNLHVEGQVHSLWSNRMDFRVI